MTNGEAPKYSAETIKNADERKKVAQEFRTEWVDKKTNEGKRNLSLRWIEKSWLTKEGGIARIYEELGIDENSTHDQFVQAVENFQKAHWLDGDGILGWKTLEVMDTEIDQGEEDNEYDVHKWLARSEAKWENIRKESEEEVVRNNTLKDLQDWIDNWNILVGEERQDHNDRTVKLTQVGDKKEWVVSEEWSMKNKILNTETGEYGENFILKKLKDLAGNAEVGQKEKDHNDKDVTLQDINGEKKWVSGSVSSAEVKVLNTKTGEYDDVIQAKLLLSGVVSQIEIVNRGSDTQGSNLNNAKRMTERLSSSDKYTTEQVNETNKELNKFWYTIKKDGDKYALSYTPDTLLAKDKFNRLDNRGKDNKEIWKWKFGELEAALRNTHDDQAETREVVESMKNFYTKLSPEDKKALWDITLNTYRKMLANPSLAAAYLAPEKAWNLPAGLGESGYTYQRKENTTIRIDSSGRVDTIITRNEDGESSKKTLEDFALEMKDTQLDLPNGSRVVRVTENGIQKVYYYSEKTKQQPTYAFEDNKKWWESIQKSA